MRAFLSEKSIPSDTCSYHWNFCQSFFDHWVVNTGNPGNFPYPKISQIDFPNPVKRMLSHTPSSPRKGTNLWILLKSQSLLEVPSSELYTTICRKVDPVNRPAHFKFLYSSNCKLKGVT